jgi:hypothetical protein
MKIFILISSLLFSLTTHAIEDKPRLWVGLIHKKAIHEDYSLWGETQLRYDLESGGMQQTLFRFGPIKRLNDKHEVALLYGFIQTGSMKEARPTLQHTQQFSQNFSARSRLEFRTLEDSDDDSLRFRYLIRLQKNLKDGLSAVVWEEPFINFTDEAWSGSRTFERNRLFIGLRIPVFQMNWEVGYMNQYIPRRSQTTMDHIATLYIFY